MKAIFDTNVFISGIFWKANFCSQLIDKWLTGKVSLIRSKGILQELINTLENFKIKMPGDMIEQWINIIVKKATIVEPTTSINVIIQDPEDNKFLEAAVEGEADLIISQDKHLLNLKEYDGIRILNPQEAWSLID